MSFVVGTVGLIVLVALLAPESARLASFKSLPLYMLLGGGLLGAIYVTVNLILAPRIGVAAIMALGIAGQLFTALLVDRLGLFALMERGLTLGRVSGALLVLVGALMVRSL
jgi:transporter family-2 protein